MVVVPGGQGGWFSVRCRRGGPWHKTRRHAPSSTGSDRDAEGTRWTRRRKTDEAYLKFPFVGQYLYPPAPSSAAGAGVAAAAPPSDKENVASWLVGIII